MDQVHRRGINAAEVSRAAEAVRACWDQTPEIAIILGTGLGGLGREISVQATVAYADVPGFPRSTVESHAGRLLCGTLGPCRVVAMQGRFHYYEGYAMDRVAFPVWVLRALGARALIVTNACGNLHPLWRAGDLMLLSDHINLIGDNPLMGPNDEMLGPRFPDMSEPYDPALRRLARAVALEQGITLREGVYAAVIGPSLETRAEYRLLRAIGADVVGMSSVPEAIAAGHAGLPVLGISIITDMCLPDALEPVSLEKIIAAANEAEPRLTALVSGVAQRFVAPARGAA